jgi:hypothetical protein
LKKNLTNIRDLLKLDKHGKQYEIDKKKLEMVQNEVFDLSDVTGAHVDDKGIQVNINQEATVIQKVENEGKIGISNDSQNKKKLRDLSTNLNVKSNVSKKNPPRRLSNVRFRCYL